MDGAPLVDQARAMHPRVKDRFDLSPECICRHCAGQVSPPQSELAISADFFDLFGSSRGYFDYFLLNDLVTSDCAGVRFHSRFDESHGDPPPESWGRRAPGIYEGIDQVHSRLRRARQEMCC